MGYRIENGEVWTTDEDGALDRWLGWVDTVEPEDDELAALLEDLWDEEGQVLADFRRGVGL